MISRCRCAENSCVLTQGLSLKCRGFTLIELLVVLVLVGLLSSLVFVSVAGGLLKSEEKRFVNGFTQDISRARASALGSGRAAVLVIDGEQRRYSINRRRWKDIPETLQVEGEGIADISDTEYGIIFYPDGSSSGGEIDIKWNSGAIDRITVDKLLGIISMEHVA